MESSNLIWLVLFLPLLGAVIQALFGGAVVRRQGAAGKRLMGTLAVAPIAIGFVLGLIVTLSLAGRPDNDRVSILTLYDWIRIYSLHVPFEVRIDPLSMTMVLIVTGIGALIHLYATGYMADDADYPRFFTYLNLFISSMLILVLGNNLALMFIGWEGVGLCSYLLIGFWYKDIANAKAANKAFIVNRVGDWGLTIGMFLIVVMLAGNADRLIGGAADGRWLSYDVILPNAVEIFGQYPGVTTFAALMIFVGACGKSAQFPLYFWLPDAMAGPTPVSALIHAATMVTAGVVLLNRLHVLFELSPAASAVVAIIGAFTALFAALIAFGQTDIKKVLAYSTVSQLGFMFIACGVGAFWAGMFHVTTHAFFKALLFLGSGAVIYAMAHEQDMRRYGNLFKYLKITAWTMIVGWLAIAGIPPLAGFWSKESILGGALGNHHAAYNFGVVAGWTGLFVAALTAMYMTRMTFLTFFGREERWRLMPAHAAAHAHADAAMEHAEAHPDATHLEVAAHAVHPIEDELSEAPARKVHGEPLHHASAHDHDEHGFFYTDEELHARHEPHDHHHALDEHHEPKEVPPSMWLPLVVLAILSVVGGFALYQSHAFEQWLYPQGLALLDKEAVSGHPHGWVGQWLMPLSIAAAVLGIVAGWFVYRRGLPANEGLDETKWRWWRRSAGNQFGYDAAVVNASVEGGDEVGRGAWRYVDAGLIDGIVNGAAWFSGRLGSIMRVAQTGYVRMYALMMLLGGVALLGYFMFAGRQAREGGDDGIGQFIRHQDDPDLTFRPSGLSGAGGGGGPSQGPAAPRGQRPPQGGR